MSHVVRAGSRIVRGEVAGALADAHRIRERARAEGFAQGREEGLASATATLVAARAEVGRKVERSAQDLQRVAVHVARAILGAEIESRPELVRGIVDRALALARRGRRVVLRVHPDDVGRLGEIRQAPDVEIVPDAVVGRGGCVIRDGRLTIDATLDTQLYAIKRALTESP